MCFDALNTNESHPSRDERDTFYFDDPVDVGNVEKHSSERYLLRPLTSTMQIRTMLNQKPQIRILSLGHLEKIQLILFIHLISTNVRDLLLKNIQLYRI